jgi:hypothetical protein
LRTWGEGRAFLAGAIKKDALAAILPFTQASSYFSIFVIFFTIVSHLAYIINATTSLLPSPSFSCYAAIMAWLVLL